MKNNKHENQERVQGIIQSMIETNASKRPSALDVAHDMRECKTSSDLVFSGDCHLPIFMSEFLPFDSLAATCSFVSSSSVPTSNAIASFKQVNVAPLKRHPALEPIFFICTFPSNNRLCMPAKVWSSSVFRSPSSKTSSIQPASVCLNGSYSRHTIQTHYSMLPGGWYSASLRSLTRWSVGNKISPDRASFKPLSRMISSTGLLGHKKVSL